MVESFIHAGQSVGLILLGVMLIGVPLAARSIMTSVRQGGGSSPAAGGVPAAGRAGEFHILAGLVEKILQQSHAERTGGAVPSAEQREQMRRELLAEILAKLQSPTPAAPPPSPAATPATPSPTS